MKISFDPLKDASNKAKHGIPLGAAAQLEWSEALIDVDNRYRYGEIREIAFYQTPRQLAYG